MGASVQRLIFSAQRDTACALDHEKPSQLAPVHANLSCSSASMVNRQSLSLFSRQAPTVSSAEAIPAPVSPGPCRMSLHSWEWRVLCALLPGLLLGLLPSSTRAESWLSRPVSRGRRGLAVSPSVFCGPWPCGRKRWGLRVGLACSVVRTQGALGGG